MAVDSRLQKFSLNTFLDLWKVGKIAPPLIAELESYIKTDEPALDSTEEIRNVIFFRFLSFKKKLTQDLTADYDLYHSNGVDFYHYLRKHMNRFFPYPGMSVFDKLFMSCAVIVAMAVLCDDRGEATYLYFGPNSWAMYFEMEFIEEFYAEGGWEDLKMYAEDCDKFQWFKMIPKRSDITNATQMFGILARDYDFDEIVKSFIRRVEGRDCSSCPKCLPLFDVFRSLAFGSKVNDFLLVEGYLQIMYKMWEEKEISDVFRQMMTMIESGSYKEKMKLARSKTRTVISISLRKDIFKGDNRDNFEEVISDLNSEDCIFCCEAIDRRSVVYLRSVIRRKATEAEFLNKNLAASSEEQALDEIKKTKNLRLFLALGIEPALSKVKMNIEKEFDCQDSKQNIAGSCQDSVQNLAVSMKNLDIHEEKEKFRKK